MIPAHRDPTATARNGPLTGPDRPAVARPATRRPGTPGNPATGRYDQWA
ncbi:hypothetical protein ABZ436_00175 [Micromonospora matsumotoense]